MKSPDYLKVGDKVGIVAPARSVKREELQACVTLLQQWGLEVVSGQHLFDVYHQFAGKDHHRAADLQQMLDDPEIRAVFCARGGYGTVRIIDSLCWDGLKQSPKWLVGYSDATVLHGHIQRQAGIQSLHAPMPHSFFHYSLSAETVESLRKALFGEPIQYSWPSHPLNRTGEASGVVAGGNLSILYAILESPSEFNLENKILFIEDLDEYLYHIERMMIALRRAGRLSRIAGLVVGGMTDMKDNTIPLGWNAEEIISKVVEDFDYPVSFNFPAGHGENNVALVMGAEAELLCGDVQRLTFKR